MRSPYVIAANLAALRIELEDNIYALLRMGHSKDDLDALTRSVDDLKINEDRLRKFRLVKSVSDTSGKSSSKSSAKPANKVSKVED